MKLKPQGANQTEVTLSDGTTILFSYETPVACHIPGEGYYRTEQNWSRTTNKHIGQFIGRHGGNDYKARRPQSFFDTLAQRGIA
jgi:hypothetical protein